MNATRPAAIQAADAEGYSRLMGPARTRARLRAFRRERTDYKASTLISCSN